jgi:hypothetical protein
LKSPSWHSVLVHRFFGSRVVKKLMRGESGISLTGLYLCGTLAFVMPVLKRSVIDTWSWWRVLLPLGLIVGFTVTNIMIAFIYIHLPISRRDPMGTKSMFLNRTQSTCITSWRCYSSLCLATTWFVGLRVAGHRTGSGFSRAKVKCSSCSEALAFSRCSRTGQGLGGR